MQKFFENTLQSNYIKALLLNTYLPIYKTIRKGDFMLNDEFYIYKTNLIQCTSAGTFEGTGRFRYVSEYKFGKKYPKYSDNFISNFTYYDTSTHERLGEYLRVFRDVTDVDLMPFYNCFSNNYLSGIIIRDGSVVNTKTTDYKVASIPIRFNQEYTIAVDCVSSMTIAPAFIQNKNTLITRLNDTDVDLTADYLNENDAIKSYSFSSFKTPVVVKFENSSSKYATYEKDLNLLIQLPANNNSSIVVLEGNYTTCGIEKIINQEVYTVGGGLSDTELNRLFLSKLSLLQFNTGESYPYADRLIEYLLNNVITHDEDITNNILRVQQKLSVLNYTDEVPDLWTDRLRLLVYNNTMQDKKASKLDATGFVDKDAEMALLRRK